MRNKKPFEIIPDSALHMEAKALSLSVAAIRRAQGKQNPADFPVDSPAWHRACLEFANDVLTVLVGRPADRLDDFAAFKLGFESEEADEQALAEERRKKRKGRPF
ncbi:hypothetical protein AWB68_08566 [Caballeronia choica]|jgi:hypothetical protein|uniref:Uncharacterized protein n=1 Tax=Caballeronia choica TaxID=326476 RepID=A0A158L591_9BURK|nr:hypothetical protein [Caballeronia choica]SAL87861.1 hypothetical protein AWB68_08566 [Caballeronia choica]